MQTWNRPHDDIELIITRPHEQACFLRRGCTALDFHSFVAGMRWLLYPFFQRILRVYGLALIQVEPNGWEVILMVQACIRSGDASPRISDRILARQNVEEEGQ
ncbi:putative abhydrolase domain-containing protein [Abeliophyllum distichum]|uniref:Abhydrolase domain-containing protein n=1 Tax=Abeliophyllum distichum TaxID=126358 RepID=A0ABD1V849_9LAMI